MKKTRPHNHSLRSILTAIFLVVSVIGIIFLSKELKNNQSILSEASSTSVALTLEPPEIVATGNFLVKVFATSTSPVGFADVSLHFDPSALKLVQEPTYSISPLTNLIKVDTLIEANQRGELSFAYGIAKDVVNAAPTGSFPLAELLFAPIKSSGTTTIEIDNSSQVVDMEALETTLTTTGTKVTIGAPSPLPSQTTNTPSPSPTTTPETPTTSAVPMIRITSPQNGSTYRPGETITVVAKAVNTKVSGAWFYLNGKFKKADYWGTLSYTFKTCTSCNTSHYTLDVRSKTKNGTILRDKIIINRIAD